MYLLLTIIVDKDWPCFEIVKYLDFFAFLLCTRHSPGISVVFPRVSLCKSPDVQVLEAKSIHFGEVRSRFVLRILNSSTVVSTHVYT